MATRDRYDSAEARSGQPTSRDRRFLQALVGIIAIIALMLVVYALVSDLPRSESDVTIEKDSPPPPEDVRR